MKKQNSEKIQVALFGHGHLGKWHLDKLKANPDVEVIAVVDPSAERFLAVERRHPGTPCLKEPSSIIDQLDAALIITPTSTHYSLLRELMEQGIHIFCEKPMVTSTKEAEALLTLSYSLRQEKKDLPIIQIGHSERMHQIWEQRLNFPQFFRSPGLVRIDRLAAFKGRACDVDVITDLMIHDLDLLLYLFSESPFSIQSTGYHSISKHWDTVSSTLHFPSGRVAILTVGRNYTEEKRQFEIINDCGTMLIDLLERKVRYSDNQGEGPKKIIESTYPARDHLQLEQELFFRSIREGAPSAVDLAQGTTAIRLTESVRKSLQSGKQLDLTINE
ncbi:MAG: Gfo/Idh/MocA family oxidoreductase [Bdellovibrionales bacterium]|jgi:predicted dehydrogenase|nr:Gfo/Idh/MocA family oxidoreductase [Bdellovibrionales bacterium]MBT3526915.1 Gfo/Idh/MocA family oxidoreductase [Bdellovibrionales bacterium]MBT7669637.1 Gfo/Idh/MocA family oxidoreductase [Bdellovibrionales bacterium]MBT7767022.1 Gfo/Idh/MocA family oxidoreductase [Bdellovibrionales bacterium]